MLAIAVIHKDTDLAAESGHYGKDFARSRDGGATAPAPLGEGAV